MSMSIFNEDSFLYNPFGSVATADNQTTAYKVQRDLQHALNYDNSVSPDTDKADYVHSREAAILKYLAEHAENSHTFRIKCDMPGDEDRKWAGARKKMAMHAPHYIKFTRVPDIRKCTFGEGKDQKTFKEVFGKDFDSLKEEEQDRIRKTFEQMYSERDSIRDFEYTIKGQTEPIGTKINMGYRLIIENTDIDRKFGWNPKEHQEEKRAEEIKEQQPERDIAAQAGVRYKDEKLDSGIMKMRWIAPRYDAVIPDELLSQEELDFKKNNPEEFAKMYSQIPKDDLKKMSDEERKEFDRKILDRKYEMFQRLDHTGDFSDNLRVVETKDKLTAWGKNTGHEVSRTMTNMTVRYPMTMAQEGSNLLERLLGRAMSAVRYR